MKNALCVLSEYAELIIYLQSLIPRNGQIQSQARVPLKSEGAGEGRNTVNLAAISLLSSFCFLAELFLVETMYRTVVYCTVLV